MIIPCSGHPKLSTIEVGATSDRQAECFPGPLAGCGYLDGPRGAKVIIPASDLSRLRSSIDFWVLPPGCSRRGTHRELPKPSAMVAHSGVRALKSILLHLKASLLYSIYCRI